MQAFYKWAANPVPNRDWEEAHLINAALDVHADDPAFGYRFITDELNAGVTRVASERRIWWLCSMNGILSVIHRKRVDDRQFGPPVHDDLLQRDLTATTRDTRWVTDITEHPIAWIPVIVATPDERWRRWLARSTRTSRRMSFSDSSIEVAPFVLPREQSG